MQSENLKILKKRSNKSDVHNESARNATTTQWELFIQKGGQIFFLLIFFTFLGPTNDFYGPKRLYAIFLIKFG
jgi:hypothetical protein